jgi:hypothetical protein
MKQDQQTLLQALRETAAQFSAAQKELQKLAKRIDDFEKRLNVRLDNIADMVDDVVHGRTL